jgi:NADP-dependent 3-hydroxy acid dehydrogenase YdfG
MAKGQLVWLVTGCSSGFGVAFIKAILARGDKAIATARRIETLKPLQDLGAAALQLDVTSPGEGIHMKIDEAVAIYGRLDVLISNAGFGCITPVEELRYTVPFLSRQAYAS